MQVIENRSLVVARVIDVGVGDERRLRMKLCSVQPLEGHRDLMSEAVGTLVEVIVPGTSPVPSLEKGAEVEAEMSFARPGVAVLHKVRSVVA